MKSVTIIFNDNDKEDLEILDVVDCKINGPFLEIWGDTGKEFEDESVTLMVIGRFFLSQIRGYYMEVV
ncbi:MAG: hypothetical protein IKU26_00845 [Clostridia bacterium]|nr:hypothetical protein [Clostridia bacterium]